MSIAYKLFGIPRTFDEFVDKVRRRGDTRVDVVLEEYDNADCGNSSNHQYVGLRSRNTELKINEHVYVRSGSLFGAVYGKAEIERAATREAAEIGERLQNLGLEVTINGKYTIEEVKRELDRVQGNAQVAQAKVNTPANVRKTAKANLKKAVEVGEDMLVIAKPEVLQEYLRVIHEEFPGYL